jgi:hypothetical protein
MLVPVLVEVLVTGVQDGDGLVDVVVFCDGERDGDGLAIVGVGVGLTLAEADAVGVGDTVGWVVGVAVPDTTRLTGADVDA